MAKEVPNNHIKCAGSTVGASVFQPLFRTLSESDATTSQAVASVSSNIKKAQRASVAIV